MEQNLVIVESPAKARTIQKFLGENYVVKSSFGHIRDLAGKKLSVDVEHGFMPEYVVPADKTKVVAELKKLAAESGTVWLASDEDREGEAISWHLYEVLGLKGKDARRIVFHEITKDAILKAVENPRSIDMSLVDAQQARRVLDRLVGFELSPVLWKKIRPGLSAGRVQSVALRLVVDKEREILGSEKTCSYKTDASFHPEKAAEGVRVNATLGTKFKTEDKARKFLEDCIGARFTVADIRQKEGVRMPPAPFTTSTLQQEAAQKLRFSVVDTMRIAQQLYERGLITYMRTDSTNLSGLAINSTKGFIMDNFGEEYSHPRQYKTKSKGAQEAHEAIRPTFVTNAVIEGTQQEKSLYTLIWKRTVASQMAEAKVLRTDMKMGSDKREEQFTAQATKILFDGFMALYSTESKDEAEDVGTIIEDVRVGDVMDCLGITSACKYTTPPSRYSEATLVKKLEELGIGRPSTYAPTISTLTTGRGYLVKGDKEGEKIPVVDLVLKGNSIREVNRTEIYGAEKGRLLPQEVGMIVTDYLVENFGSIMDYDFTANVENDFDRVAGGELPWNSIISTFYTPFHGKIDEVLKDGKYCHPERMLGTDPKDGKTLTAKFGQYGPYVQKGEGEDRQYAKLAAGQLIDTLTLEEAARLFELPRLVGQLEGIDIIATTGRFGPYIKYGDKTVSLPRGKDPLKISLEECSFIILAAKENGSSVAAIKEFEGSDIKVMRGRYGLYIKQGSTNFKLPKDAEPEKLTENECKEIIARSEPTSKKRIKKKSSR